MHEEDIIGKVKEEVLEELADVIQADGEYTARGAYLLARKVYDCFLAIKVGQYSIEDLIKLVELASKYEGHKVVVVDEKAELPTITRVLPEWRYHEYNHTFTKGQEYGQQFMLNDNWRQVVKK